MNPWTEEAQYQNQSTTSLDDRRSVERTAPVAEGIHIWLDEGRRIRVEIIDESPRGIGVIIPDMSFTFGPRIDVDYCGERRKAVVAHLSREGDRQYRLGLEWIQLREV